MILRLTFIAPYTPSENGGAKHMICPIKNGIRTLMIQADARASFCVIDLYLVDDLHNRITHQGCTKTPEELLTGARASAGHLQMFVCNVRAPVHDKRGEALNAKAGSGVSL